MAVNKPMSPVSIQSEYFSEDTKVIDSQNCC